VIEDFLEFDNGLDALARGEIGHATHIDRVQRANKVIRTAGVFPTQWGWRFGEVRELSKSLWNSERGDFEALANS
jgi:hypothetical protein